MGLTAKEKIERDCRVECDAAGKAMARRVQAAIRKREKAIANLNGEKPCKKTKTKKKVTSARGSS